MQPIYLLLELISEVTTSASQASVSFTSIAATYRDLEVHVRGRGTQSATLIDMRMRFNNDTAATLTPTTNEVYRIASTRGLPVITQTLSPVAVPANSTVETR